MGWRPERISTDEEILTDADLAAEAHDRAVERARAAGIASFKLNPHRFELIVQLIMAGNYAKVACASVGITEGTYGNYLRRGRTVNALLVELYGDDHGYDMDDKAPPKGLDVPDNDWTCFRFLTAIEIASAKGETQLATEVRAGVKDNPALGLQILERRHPRRWKRRDLHEIASVDTRDGDEDLLDPDASELVHQALAAAAEASRRPAAIEATSRVITDDE